MRANFRRSNFLCLLSVSLLVACGDMSTSDGDDSEEAVFAGTVTGTVSYAGSEEGSLSISARQSIDEQGPPAYFVTVTVDADNPFPVSYELPIEKAGTWFIVSNFDVGANNPTFPGAEDKASDLATAESVMLSEDNLSAMVDLTIAE